MTIPETTIIHAEIRNNKDDATTSDIRRPGPFNTSPYITTFGSSPRNVLFSLIFE